MTFLKSESDDLDCATAVCAAEQIMSELFGSGQMSETLAVAKGFDLGEVGG
jgi:hypothetical protein